LWLTDERSRKDEIVVNGRESSKTQGSEAAEKVVQPFVDSTAPASLISAVLAVIRFQSRRSASRRIDWGRFLTARATCYQSGTGPDPQ
jgi:hypothetical protein